MNCLDITLFFLLISIALFSIGVLGVLIRRNVLVMLISLELMLNAVNLSLLAFSKMHNDIGGQVFALFIMCVIAAELAVGLAIIICFYRNFYSTDVNTANTLRG